MRSDRRESAISTSRRPAATKSQQPLAYLTSEYPTITHTFIQTEVAALRELGYGISTFALNPHEASHILTDLDAVEAEATPSLKALSVASIVRRLLRCLSHPIAVVLTLCLAWKGVGLDLGRGYKRTMQVGEGLVLATFCRNLGLRHLHAHFGHAPANVAWFATHYLRKAYPAERFTWSFTIHGPQDCLDEPPRLLRRKVESSNLVVAVADYTRAQLIRHLPISMWSRVHVVRCGIDLSSPPRPEQSPRQDGVFTILIVARLRAEKGHAVAIEAVAELVRRGHKVELQLVGPGDFNATFGELADELGVRSCITFFGPLAPADVEQKMREAMVMCLPSFAEGLPVVVMEAMAVGLPVVASGISGIPELIEHGVTGLLVPPGRPDCLADELEKLLTDAPLRTSIARNGRARVEQLHDERTNARQLACLFEALAAESDVR